MDYRVDLEVFNGPLDLLLYLVKRNEVDVLHVPIARIVEQYLLFLNVLQALDVDAAGDFLVMASTLMEIKSRMLLPRPETTAADEDDPRRELVKQLLEYKKFKEAAAELEVRATAQSRRFARQPVPALDNGLPAPQPPLHAVEVWDLVAAFQRLLDDTQPKQPEAITADETPIQEHAENLLARLQRQPRLLFRDAFTPPYSRSRLIGLFLALLELIKGHRVSVEQEDAFADIWLVLLPTTPNEPPSVAIEG